MSSKKSASERSKRASARTQSVNLTSANDDQTDEFPQLLERPKDIRIISITINYLRNILPLYPVSDIKISIKYLDKILGETQLTPITDDDQLSINETFELILDLDSPKQLDLISSSPVFITAIQYSGTLDATLYEQLQKSKVSETKIIEAENVESLFSIYEAFTGEKPGVRLNEIEKKKKKGKNKEKSDKSANNKSRSKSSTTSKTSEKSKKSTNKSSKSSVKSSTSKSKSDTQSVVIKSEEYGMCVIDMISLLYGETFFSETLQFQPIKRSCNILSTYKNFPEVSLTVSLKDNEYLPEITNILNVTVESICNVPSLLYTELDCSVCLMLPLQNNGNSPTLFHNPKITSTSVPKKEVPKRWPGIHDIGYNANTTKYFIDSDFSQITNKSNLNIEDAFLEEAVRIEYNYLKRNLLYKSANRDFATHILTHRKIVLEIYAIPKSKKHKSMEPASLEDAEEHPKHKAAGKIPPYLHLMAVLDVVGLLYPGVTKLRIAAPVKTFTYEEAAKCGLEDSYFMPKPRPDLITGRASKLDGSKKKSDGKKEKSSKKDKASQSKEDKNLANQLPPKPEEPPVAEPSVQVYNEDGKECFIIIELELLKPINAKRDLDELQEDLYNLQMDAIQTSKTILNKNVADDFYIQTIREILDDLNKKWIEFNEAITTIPAPTYGNFVEFLQKNGSYQTYINSITRAAALLITNKYKCEETDFKNNKHYQNLISEIFTELISEMHSVINSLVCKGMKPLEEKYSTSSQESFFFAKEAAELQLHSLAERYFLERTCIQSNPDYWVDFAIYNIEINLIDYAFECIKEAIALNANHKYALLLFGVLLTEKEKIQDAETCFLNLLVLESKWAEGWCVLYLFYQKCARLDGIEMAMDMAKKLTDRPIIQDYFNQFEDLAWSSKEIPDTLFFNTAKLLLKMRLYSWVELAIAEEILVPKYYGYVNYLLAVISYYKKNYQHALEHIEEATESLGASYSILALSGHTFYKLGDLQKSKDEYFKVIESFDRPENIHLVYLNCAEILDQFEDDQLARKLMLTACKLNQTPHVWFIIGKLYFKENDLLSAEECFNEANMRDNRYPEVWGFLTLVNLKLNRLHEAEQCYQQATKSKLNDKLINDKIIDEFNKIRN